MTNTTQKRYAIRIRTEGSNTDSERDWLHEDHTTRYEYRTFAEANAACEEAVWAFLTDVLGEEPASWSQETEYAERDGGGFWFAVGGDDEPLQGRVCVLTAEFDA